MAIERRQATPDTSESVVTTACPFCEVPLDDQASLARHIREGHCKALGGGADAK